MANSVKGTPVEVDVYANPPGSPSDYEIDWKFQGGQSQGNTPIVLPKGSGSHDLTFTLHDSSGKGLKFKPQPEDAMWTHPGNKCPTGPGNGNGQITNGSVINGCMTLKVTDDNSGNPARLQYMLRFDPPGNDFDPEIRNGGGGRTYTRIAAGIGGAVVGALIASVTVAEESMTMTLVGALAGGAVGYLVGSVLEK